MREVPDFAGLDRQQARSDFALRIPERFNFVTDVIDRAPADRIAIRAVSAAGEVRDISQGMLAAEALSRARALTALGLRPGARVLMVMGRVPGWLFALLGCIRAGIVAMPGTTLLTARDMAHRINAAGAEAVIVSPAQCAKVEAIRAECPGLRHLIVAGGVREGWLALNDLPSPDTTLPDTLARDPMLIYFTSGTTAAPKLVPRDHGYALAHAATGLFWMDLRPGDLHWTLTDTGWAKAAWGLVFPPLLLGATVLLVEGREGFDAAEHLALIARHQVTTFCAPPTVWRMIAQEDLSRFDLSSLRRCLGSGEPLNPEAMRVWKAATGLDIADGYGQTESVNLIGNFPGMEVRPGSMGLPVPGFDVDVIAEDGTRLPPGEIGHVAVRVADGPPPGLFPGYLGPEGPDRRAFRHGWYFTGDTARRDRDGYFWFIGRSDDLILSAGYRISPFEVESTLLEHPAVLESAVVGVPDLTRGEILRAFVVPAPGHQPGPELATQIQDFCKAATAPYKYPREIVFVDSLPKTISGKIRRVALRGL